MSTKVYEGYRGKMWDKVCLDDWHNSPRLDHDIVTMRAGEAASTVMLVMRKFFPKSFRG